ncbi:hypothetical protein DL89DRAFT_113669 [Linderina pennispora]|uniref:Endoplasmic reticulum junction formation protein lunapark n=1 Tax=Linderina pennispora TaxID=61395 RepID=A0A1Y1WG70_9FUNG|nr:uncharacterized protein DL89DRAFT_113669 [Linderina pennispora]ORX72487.1 hypothetical protein DL89DRAFT_113669 [Linderina pennispora]
MGLFSFLKKKDEDFEKILGGLEQDLKRTEKQRQQSLDRTSGWSQFWLTYTSIAWIGYLLGFILYVFPERHDSQALNFPQHCLAVLLGPFIIYYGNYAIRMVGRRAVSGYERQIKKLRQEINERVDELKKKTAYDSTKTLVDRYSSAARGQPEARRRTEPAAPAGSPQASPLAGRGKSQPANGLMAMRNAQAASMGGNAMATVPQPVFQPVASGVVRTQAAQPPRTGSEPRPWLDKLVEGLVGDMGPQDKYALICRHCFAHNGLVLPDEVDVIQYSCPKCGKFNPSRRALDEQRRRSDVVDEFYSDKDGEPMEEEAVDYEYMEDDEASPVRKSRREKKPRQEARPAGSQSDNDKAAEADDEHPSAQQEPQNDLPPETPTKPEKQTMSPVKRKGKRM